MTTLSEAYREVRQYNEDVRRGRKITLTLKYRYRRAKQIIEWSKRNGN